MESKATHTLTLVFVLSCLLLQSIRLSGDGLSYYAYARSVLFDRDLDFTNEFQEYNPLDHATPDPTLKTKTGLVANPYAVGPAILWSPFVLAVHLLSLAARFLNPTAATSSLTGYEFQYIAGVTLGTSFYALLGLLTWYDLSAKYFGHQPALLAVLAVWLGTSFVNYAYFEPTYSHVLSAAWVAMFIWAYRDYRQKGKWVPLMGAGVAAGLMVVTRWQNVLFFLIPAVDIAFALPQVNRYRPKQVLTRVAHTSLFVGISLAIFAPQMMVWRHIYGDWLVVPMGGGFIRWLSPSLFETLFSARNGLFSWTPLVALSLPGLWILYRSDRKLALGLTAAILAQWWLNASAIDWWGGGAFGSRRFVGSSVIFVLGLAALLQAASVKRISWAISKCVLVLAIVWNLALWTQYAIGTPAVQWVSSLGQMYLGQLEYGIPHMYRLLGRSTWLDLAIRSGILQQNWGNVLIAFIWSITLTSVAYLAARAHMRLRAFQLSEITVCRLSQPVR